MHNAHTWVLSLDTLPLPAWFPLAARLLDDAETQRLNNYKSDSQKLQFLAGRWLVKTMVGDICAVSPKCVIIGTQQSGKPYIEHPVCSLHISLSHTQHFAVCGVAGAPIGVDVESCERHVVDIPKISRLINPTVANVIGRELKRDVPRYTIDSLFTAFWCALESLVKIRASSVFAERKTFMSGAKVDVDQRLITIQHPTGEGTEVIRLGKSFLAVGVNSSKCLGGNIKQQVTMTGHSLDTAQFSLVTLQ